ncbi:hypothetical protein LCGC14_2701620, partial [marine sediment metagenome]
AGTYMVGEQSAFIGLDMASGVTLRGSGPGSIIKRVAGEDIHLLYVLGVTGVVVTDLVLDGNKLAEAVGFHVVRIDTASDVWINRCVVKNGRGHGIVTSSTPAHGSTRLLITNNLLESNGSSGAAIGIECTQVLFANNIARLNVLDGLQDKDTVDATYTGNICYDNQRCGIQRGTTTTAVSPVAGLVVGNICHDNGASGIKIDSTNTSVVSGNVTYENTLDGVSVESSSAVTVSGNVIFNNLRYGVFLRATGADAERVIVTDNLIYDTQGTPTQYAIIGADGGGFTTHDIVVVDNVLYGNQSSNAISALGSGSVIRDNVGYVTDASGATNVADGGTVAHGLSATPTNVTVTASVAAEFVSVTALGATTFTVAIKKHDGFPGTTQDVYWRARKN